MSGISAGLAKVTAGVPSLLPLAHNLLSSSLAPVWDALLSGSVAGFLSFPNLVEILMV